MGGVIILGDTLECLIEGGLGNSSRLNKREKGGCKFLENLIAGWGGGNFIW